MTHTEILKYVMEASSPEQTQNTIFPDRVHLVLLAPEDHRAPAEPV